MAIPKILHFCWFSGEEKPALFQRCLDSWRAHLQDYEIMEWNSRNFDMETSSYSSEAFGLKKWAFVSDCVRVKALNEYGGIYLDLDVEVKGSLDRFLDHSLFLGFERPTLLATFLIGSEKGQPFIKELMGWYDDHHFIVDEKPNMTPNPYILTELFIKKYGLWKHLDRRQRFPGKVVVYPSKYFCLGIGDAPHYTVHHFSGSWLDGAENSNPYKHQLEQELIENLALRRRLFLIGKQGADALGLVGPYGRVLSLKNRIQ